MITARHISGTRKSFQSSPELIAFMNRDPNPELWHVNLDGLKCTGAVIVKAAPAPYRTKTQAPRKSYRGLLSEVKALQKTVRERQAILARTLPQRESIPELNQGKNFEIIYSLTQ